MIQLTTLILAIIIAGFTFSFSYIGSFYDLFLLAIIGFTGGTGVIFLIWGYRLTEPSLIAPFEYFGPIQKELEQREIPILSSGFERIPTNTKSLSPEETEEVEKLLEKIEEDDDVQNVYHTMV